MSFSNYDLIPFPYVGSEEGFQALSAQDVSYNEISNILRESGEFSEEEIKEISSCVYTESEDIVMEKSVEKILIKSYRKNYKKVFKNIKRIKFLMFQKKYDEAHLLTTETISDLVEMKKETEALALDPDKYDLPVLIKLFAFIIKQIIIIIDTILVANIPVFRHFAVSEVRTLSKSKHMLPGNVDSNTDFITLKHRILDVYDELIMTLTSIDNKIKDSESMSIKKAINRVEMKYKISIPYVYRDYAINHDGDPIQPKQISVHGYRCEVSRIIPISGDGLTFEKIVDNDRVDGFVNPNLYPIASNRGGDLYYWNSKDNAVYLLLSDDIDNPFRVSNSIEDFFALFVGYKRANINEFSIDIETNEVVSNMNRYNRTSIYTEAGIVDAAGKFVTHFKSSIKHSMAVMDNIYKEYQKAVEEARAYDEMAEQQKEKLQAMFERIVDKIDDLEESLDHDLGECESYAQSLEDINSVLRIVNDEIQKEIENEKEKELEAQEEQIDDAVEDISMAMEFCGNIDEYPVFMEDGDEEEDKSSEKVNPVIIGKCLAIKSIYKSAYNKLLGVVRKLKTKVESLKNKLSNKSVKTESVSIYSESGIMDAINSVVNLYKVSVKSFIKQVNGLAEEIKHFDEEFDSFDEEYESSKRKFEATEQRIEESRKKFDDFYKTIDSQIKDCESKYHLNDLVNSFSSDDTDIYNQMMQQQNQEMIDQMQLQQMMTFCSCRDVNHDLSTFVENSDDDAKKVSPIAAAKYLFTKKNYKTVCDKIKAAFDKLEQKLDKIKSKIKNSIKKESVDVDESSSSFLGQMLPQTPLTTEEDYNTKEIKDLAKTIDMDYLNDDMDVFDPNSDILESDIMATEAGFIEALKEKFGWKERLEGTEVNTKLVTDACQLYSKIQNSQNRMKLMLVKDSAAKSTQVYRDYAKTLVASEKKLRVLKKKMTQTETNMFNTYCKNLDNSLKSKMEESVADIKEANAVRDKIKMECGDAPFFNGDMKCLPESSNNLYGYIKTYNLKLDILFQSIKKKLSVQNYCSVVEHLDEAIGLINCSRKMVVSQLSQAGECNDIGCPDMICMVFDHINEIMDKVHSIMPYYSLVDMPRIVTCMKCACDSHSSLSSNINSIVGAYNSIINTINQLKVHTEALCNNSTYTSEAADIDTAIADSVIVLNKKGYKTKYSSAGHNKLKPWKDGDGDGKYEGILNSDARIQFDGCYEFPKAPKYWKWRSVEGNDYLDVIEVKYDKKDGPPPEAFQKWKDKYLSTLETWVKNLPEAKPIVKEKDVEDKDVSEETPKEISKENDVKESVEEMFNTMMETLFIEASF